jgi:hypothetical protein
MDETERLFPNTLRDLRTRVASQAAYAVRGALGPIRKLPLDETPLIDPVNRKYRRKISFEVAQPRDTAPPFLVRQAVAGLRIT